VVGFQAFACRACSFWLAWYRIAPCQPERQFTTQKHLFHLATSCLVKLLVSIQEQTSDEGSEMAHIWFVDILRHRIEQVERWKWRAIKNGGHSIEIEANIFDIALSK